MNEWPALISFEVPLGRAVSVGLSVTEELTSCQMEDLFIGWKLPNCFSQQWLHTKRDPWWHGWRRDGKTNTAQTAFPTGRENRHHQVQYGFILWRPCISVCTNSSRFWYLTGYITTLTFLWRHRKIQRISKVCRSHPLGTMNICMNACTNSSSRCREISQVTLNVDHLVAAQEKSKDQLNR